MIEIVNLSKDYGKKLAVDHMNLSLKDGEVFGLLGPNGAGKSTTIKMMTGILQPSDGDVIVQGHSIVRNAMEAKKNFTYVADTPDFFLGMTALDYFAFLASVYQIPKDEFEKNLNMYSEIFHMKDALPELIVNDSHGMRQKVFLIGSLLLQPKNWILDEPLTGLDPDAAYQVKNLMRNMAKDGKTVLFSTHVLDVAEKVCDRIGIISHGQLRFAGSIDELRKKENILDGDLEDLFLNLTK